MFEILSDPAGDVIAGDLVGDADRIGNPVGIGTAMAFHHEAVEPEENRAIVIIGVEMVAQQLEVSMLTMQGHMENQPLQPPHRQVPEVLPSLLQDQTVLAPELND